MSHPNLLKYSIALALIALLPACNDSNKSTSTTTATEQTAPTGKNDVVIANGAEPESLDPQKASDGASFVIARQLFLGLVDIDDNGKTVPSMASEWNNENNKVWTFKLRDANWSDGTPITAHDFVYSLRRLTDPKTASPYGSYLVDGKVLNAEAVAEGKLAPDTLGVVALDDKTLQITLSEPVPYFVDLLALPAVFAVPQKTVERFGDQWTDPANIVVSGAYKLTDWGVNSHVTLERNPAFYDNANTSIEKVTFLPITGIAEINRFKAGEVDLTSGVEPEQYQALKAELGEQVQSSPLLCTTYLDINTKKAPFDNVDVRRALNLSFDRPLFTDKVLATGQKPAYQLTPASTAGMGDVTPDWATQDMATRSKDAVSLLTKAGYSKDNPLPIQFVYTSGDTGKKIVSAATAMWNENLEGLIKIEPVNYEWKMVLENRRQGNFDIALAGWCADYNEPSTFLNTLKSKNSNNGAFYKNPDYDKTLDATLQVASSDERTKLYHDAERILQADSPVIPLYTPSGNYLIKPYLKGVSKDDPTRSYNIRHWQIAQ